MLRPWPQRCRQDLCEIVERANATINEALGVFQDPTYRDRIAVLHFGGHAGSCTLLLESREVAAVAAYAPGLARFLGEQRGLSRFFSTAGLPDAGISLVIATSQSIACAHSAGESPFDLESALATLRAAAAKVEQTQISDPSCSFYRDYRSLSRLP